MDSWQREVGNWNKVCGPCGSGPPNNNAVDFMGKRGCGPPNYNNAADLMGKGGCGPPHYHNASDFMGKGNWGLGYGPYDRPRGNYSDCPKLKTLTPAEYRVFETAVERWSLTTAHPMTNNAFEVIKALPTEIAALFASTPNSMLMTAGGVEYVMNHVKSTQAVGLETKSRR